MRIGIGVVACLTGASLFGGVATWVATRRGFQRYPPPGQLLEVDGHRLHLYCTGQGGTTVVLESALGGWSIDWAPVQPALERDVRVCSYDRAGYGWSDASHRSYDPNDVARELHALLRAGAVPGPYLLVGHSVGGLYVRSFAALYPDEIAGLVLIDASHEQLLRRLPPEAEAVQQTKQLKYLRWVRYLTITGVTRLFRIPVANSPDLPGPQRKIASAIGYRFDRYEAFYNEAAAFVAATGNGSFVLGRQPDVPVTVLTSRENLEDPTTGTAWRQLQDEIAMTYPRVRQQLVESGHFIQIEAPNKVVEAVRDVLVRSGG